MKKKIISLCLVVALAAVAVVGATLAYFTDTDDKTNTFTTTGVDIQLIEQQRSDDGTKLEAFENGQVLYPIVGSAQGGKDTFGLPTAANYVDKIVTVKNLKANAYVRVYYAIPTVLDNVGDASQNIIHVNNGNKFVAAGNKTDVDVNEFNEHYEAYMGDETTLTTNYAIDGVNYNIYYRDYNKVLGAAEVTGAAFIVGLYMDKDVDYNGTAYTITRDGETSVINFDFSKGVNIPVFAVGVQAAGFTSCADAVTAAFGADFNPWATSAD